MHILNNLLIDGLLPDHATLHSNRVHLCGRHSGRMFAHKPNESAAGHILAGSSQIY